MQLSFQKFHIFFILGSSYVKDGSKRAKCRYNYQTGFRRKMQQYTTSTNDNVAIQFYQSTTKSKSADVYRYATKPGLAMRTATVSSAVQTELPTNEMLTSTPDVSLVGLPSGSRSEESTLASPSVKRKKLASNRNICRKCKISYGGCMDNEYESIWINCEQRGCDYWVHLNCLGFVVKEEDEEIFSKTVKYFCCSHNPKKLPKRRSILK